MIEVFKITHGIYDSDASLKLAYHPGFVTRGNKYKLLNNRFHYDLRKHYTVHLDINTDTRTRGRIKKLVVKRCHYDVRKYSFCVRVSTYGIVYLMK